MYLQGKQNAFREGFSSVKRLVSSNQLPQQHPNNKDNRPDTFAPRDHNEGVAFDLDDPLIGLPDGFKA